MWDAVYILGWVGLISATLIGIVVLFIIGIWVGSFLYIIIRSKIG